MCEDFSRTTVKVGDDYFTKVDGAWLPKTERQLRSRFSHLFYEGGKKKRSFIPRWIGFCPTPPKQVYTRAQLAPSDDENVFSTWTGFAVDSAPAFERREDAVAALARHQR